MIKKLSSVKVSLLIAVTMLTSFLPPAVSAEGTDSEIRGVYYTIKNNTAIVTGSADGVTNVEIEDKVNGYAVTKIESKAFKDKKSLERIKIADSVTLIGESAFSGCEKLSQIQFPSELVDTGRYIFYGCTSLTEVVLPGKLSNLAEHAFANCTSLKEVVFPASINNSDGGHSVRGEWFEGCTALEKVTFSEGATRIPPRAFADCREIELIIPDTIKSIGFGAFSGVDWIEDIDFLPEGVETIESDAFSYCPNLKTAILPESATSVQGKVFRYSTALKEVTVNKNVEKAYDGYNIGGDWFEGCTALERVTFENGAEVVPNNLFVSCKEIEIVLPETIKTIMQRAFAGVDWIENLDFLPDSVETIEKNAFNGCKNLNDISKLGETLKYIGEAAFADCDSLEAVSFEEGLQGIGHLGFAECDKLKDISLPESLTALSSGAFRNCPEITEIIIPKNVVDSTYGYNEAGWWFEGCTSLKNIYIENGATVIPTGAFRRLSGNVNIMIPESVKEIQAGAFAGSSLLSQITLPSNLEVIEGNVFDRCTSLKNIYIPGSVTTIYDNAFSNCADDLVVHCGGNTLVADVAAAADVYHVYTGNRVYNNLISKSTGYYADGSNMISGGYVTLTAKYQINTSVAQRPDPAELKLTIPQDCRLGENPVYVNSEPISSYKLSGNVLSVTGLPAKATVSVILLKEGARDIISRASLTFWSIKTGYVIQTIGTTCEPVRTVSVGCDPYTNDGNVMVSGIATPESVVKLYADGVFSAETVSNKAGSYKALITIPEPSEGQTYTIKAVIGDNEAEAKETSVTYNPDMPSLISAYLYPNNHLDPDLRIDLTAPGKIQTVEFWPVKSYTFEIKYTNPELIEKVIITSIKSSGRKSVEAYYDAEADAFVSKKLFDPNNIQYIPGDIEIQFIKKAKYTKEELEEIKEKIQSYVDLISPQYMVEYEDFGLPVEGGWSGYIKPNGTGESAKMGFSSTYDPDFDPEAIGVKPFIDAYNGLVFGSRIVEKANGEQFREMFVGDIESGMLYTLWFALDVGWGEHLGKAEYGVIGDLVTLMDIGKNLNMIGDVRNNLKISNSPDKEERIARLDELTFGYLVAGYAAIGIGIVGGSVVGASAAFIAFSYICGAIVSLIMTEFIAEITGSDNGFIAKLRWLIDPSGYVYEGVTTNRIQGATVTVYYKDSETGEPIIWDAENYDQKNPLITNTEGRYSWVVPEGEWMVKCEMDGYDTVFTEWLPVPPPQMDVNIGLVSKAVPVAEITEAAGNKVRVVFSKYMIPETVENVVFTDMTGEILDYTVSYPTEETDADGKVLAKAFTFEFEDMPEDEVILKLCDRVLSYAEVAAEMAEITIPVIERISEITAPESIDITAGGSRRIKLDVSGYTDVDIVAQSDTPSVAFADSITGSAEDGAFYAVVSTFGCGTAQISFRVVQTGETITTTVKSDAGKAAAVKEVVQYENGTEVQLLNAGETYLSGICIMAVYSNGGKLLNIASEKFEGDEREINISFDGFVPETENYKIMIVNSLSEIKPIGYTY